LHKSWIVKIEIESIKTILVDGCIDFQSALAKGTYNGRTMGTYKTFKF
jgi:hypothetical protein